MMVSVRPVFCVDARVKSFLVEACLPAGQDAMVRKFKMVREESSRGKPFVRSVMQENILQYLEFK